MNYLIIFLIWITTIVTPRKLTVRLRGETLVAVNRSRDADGHVAATVVVSTPVGY